DDHAATGEPAGELARRTHEVAGEMDDAQLAGGKRLDRLDRREHLDLLGDRGERGRELLPDSSIGGYDGDPRRHGSSLVEPTEPVVLVLVEGACAERDEDKQ